MIDALTASRPFRPPSGPIRLLIVTPLFFPYHGGVAAIVHALATRLQARGIKTTIVTTDTSGTLPAEELVADVPVIRVPAFPRNGDYYFAPAIYRIVRDGPWDLVHCHSVNTLVPPLALVAAQRAGLPTVVTFHTGGHSSRLRNLFRGAQWTALGPILRKASRLIASAEFEARSFGRWLGLPRDQFSVIPNGSDLPMVERPERQAGSPLIMTIGRIERYKGQHRVVAAFRELLRHFPAARLEIVGSGPFQPTVEQQIHRLGIGDRATVRSVPGSDRAEMARVIARASVVVQLSEYEAHSVAVMEALALGCPVVVADRAGLAEVARNGLAQAVNLYADPATVADVIAEQIRRPLVPPRIELPTWDQVTEQYLTLYQSVIEGQRCVS